MNIKIYVLLSDTTGIYILNHLQVCLYITDVYLIILPLFVAFFTVAN